MKRATGICGAILVLAAVGQIAWAQEGVKPYQIVNRLRLEYDDNIYQEETNQNDSFKVIEELEFMVNLKLEQTFLSLRYRPSFVWWEAREPDDTDFQHEADFILNHTFTPRLALSVVDTFRRGELPELVDSGMVVREKDDFIYNTANATLSVLLRPATRLDVSGRHILLRYDWDAVADTEDFDMLVGGLTLRQQVLPETAILAEYRFEDISYEGPERGSQTQSGGLGVEHTFNPNLISMLHGGYQRKEYDAAALGSESSPYADLVMTFLPTPATRLSLGGGYSFFETDAFPFANQTRTRVYASLAHDLTARLSLFLSGAYTEGDYKAEESVKPTEVLDGKEKITQVSARGSYKVNRSNWLEAGWAYTDFDSELRYASGDPLRSSYERNRISVGWKTQF